MSDLDSCVGDIGATLDEQSRQVGEGAQAPTILIVGAGPGGLRHPKGFFVSDNLDDR
jgi:hypothetical protein